MSIDVRSLRGKTALVTGAASGIGRASALAFAARGADLVICDVDETGLKDTEESLRGLGRDVLTERVDVASADEMREFAARVVREAAAPDILMNNAGVGLGAGFLDTSLEDWTWILGINLRGVIHGCHYFVPGMVERGTGGHVVNVASMAAFLPTEALSAYTTTKYAVLGLSESLRMELAPHDIGVTAVCPGLINTPITRSARLRGKAAVPGARENMVKIYERRNYTADQVARSVVRAIRRNRAVAPVSPEAWLFYYLKRIAPGAVRGLMGLAERRNLNP